MYTEFMYFFAPSKHTHTHTHTYLTYIYHNTKQIEDTWKVMIYLFENKGHVLDIEHKS